jgi:hypothetical protein
MLRKIFGLGMILSFALAAAPSWAGEFWEEVDDLHFRGGGGGPMWFRFSPDLNKLNLKVSDIGLKKLNSSISLWGGGGWGFVSDNFRIGGLGAGGSVTSKGIVDSVSKEVNLSIGFGGVTGEYVLRPINRVELSLGALLGWGGVTIKLSKNKGPISWDGIWGDYKQPVGSVNTSSSLKNSFFGFMPWIGVKYSILEWMGIGANIGYFQCWMDKNKWKTDKLDLHDVPDIDLSDLAIRLDLTFGG